MNTLALAWRLLRRDARAGELRLLGAALAVAVAALSSVGFFTDRVHRALELESHQLIGADMVLISDHPWRDEVRAHAVGLQLRIVETELFPSMVSAGEGDARRSQLADIKAVGPGYPLRGRLRTATAVNAQDAVAEGVPAPGTAWADERLAAALGLKVGDPLELGDSRLRLGAILTLEPDRGVNFFSVAPRLMMNVADLPATHLIQTGSRVGYRLLVAGYESALEAFRRWMQPRLGRGERLEDSGNARPEMRNAMDRAGAFLNLAALLSVVLAGVAMALAARRYVARHLDGCAVMRCFGASQGQILRLHLGQFLMLGMVASVAGCAAGYAGHYALYASLADLVAAPLPHPGLRPAWQAILVGQVLLLAFALPPLLQLKQVPTLRVLRRDLTEGRSRLWAAHGAGLVLVAALMFGMAGDPRLGGYVVGGFAAAVGAFALLARLAVRASQVLRRGAAVGFGWRHGLAALERRAGAVVLQIVALALGFMALLLLTVTRGDLLDAWRRGTPADAPNRFVINIQPEQVAPVARFFAAEALNPELLPMVRGRLVRINGKAVAAGDYEDERAQRLVEREFNLSWRDALPPGNRIVDGRGFTAADRGQGVATVEEGLARTLGLKVGDRLEFSVADEPVTTTVVGLRKLDWDSMRVNFFVLTPSGVLERYPASYITAFHLPAGREETVTRLVRAFANLTVIDVAAILKQLRGVIDQVAGAVQFIFLFTLVAGIVVLHAALLSAYDERRFELAVMRALGARQAQLRRALFAEFAFIGAFGGSLAAVGAGLVGEVLARKVFQLESVFPSWLPVAAAIVGALLVAVAGGLASRGLMAAAPIEALRAGE